MLRTTVRRFSRIPVRVRVTLAFTGVMAVVLVLTGVFLYVRLASELDATIEQGLRARAGDVTALLQASDGGLDASGRSPLTERGENLAQVLDPRGRVVDATPTLRSASLLDGTELDQAQRATVVFDEREIPGEGDPARLLATPTTIAGRDYVVVVGAPTEDRRDALRNLAGLLLLGGPVALLLASLAGYGAAAAALRPVERMRREAAAIAAEKRGRLPVGPADDEIGRLGETLNAMLDRLHHAFERERTFVSDASHELRTPLAILKAELELAIRGEQDLGELQAAIVSAAEETDRLIALAEDLLVIARADQGRLPIRRERIDVGALLDAAAQRFERRANDVGATVAVAAPSGLSLDADHLRLDQAVGNLLDNALRHGGRQVELYAAPTPDGDVVIAVRDDGPGFPVPFLERAFERFSRADIARARGGSGLGLSIVDAIARSHGGKATAVNNTPDAGATVSVRLPPTGA